MYIPAGTYTVTITDANGCIGTITVTISQPVALAVTETHQNTKCNGASDGKINLGVSGGTAPYSYSWNNGAYTSNINSLIAGTYTVLVTDANGCTGTITVTISQPAVLAVAETHQDVKCNGASDGKINLSVSGGTAPYSYSWSNGASTNNISSLAAGSYTVLVTDANGCTSVKSITISQPAALLVTETHEDVKCFGTANGKITLNVTGGSAPYVYAWSNGSAEANLSGLSAGSYKVTVTDANGCSAVKEIGIIQPSLLTASLKIRNTVCKDSPDGNIDVTISGGIAPYTFIWNDNPSLNKQNISGVTAGKYKLFDNRNRRPDIFNDDNSIRPNNCIS